ncbi:MAG TPA: SUMF1/EgtB/PvdO family nonheme iron enzyme, partial [Bacteroidales bacterium]|nr:SUMF1/EgtB/PvdO family nonheme iron enzyme [Bacteroidales bacterium]
MKKFYLLFIPGIIVGVLLLATVNKTVKITSTNDYCVSCHIHPEADALWKKSTHYDTRSGYRANCVDCHLPPKGHGYLVAKLRTGLRDLWSYWTRDSASFDWKGRRGLEEARVYVYESTCIDCHKNLFPVSLSKEGSEAHLYYNRTREKEDLNCINCHLNAGHYIEGYTHGSNKNFGTQASVKREIFTSPATVNTFSNFTEYIPGTPVSFRMIAVPGGRFSMGSPDSEPFRNADEGPVHEVEVSSFFMAETETSWEEYLAFYLQTAAEGRSTDTEGPRKRTPASSDAISGATPPYGQPDQGWGLGERPAISFSFHAAETYCRWLSRVTGKKYRLPTEAEWEYACRGGSQAPYFFPGDPKKFQRTRLLARFLRDDTAVINSYIIYSGNSAGKTQLPHMVRSNPFGLKNMSGNVAEFCSDWYSKDAYSQYAGGVVKDPSGPDSGEEHVIRGGSFLSTAGAVRSAARDYTHTGAWLKTDPQMPKSIWWYSDCFNVGFRVVCETDEKTGDNT